MNTPTSPKLAAGGITGAAALVIVYVASLFGIDVPTEVAIALVTVATFVAGYFTPDPLRQDAGEVELDADLFNENDSANDEPATGGIVRGSSIVGEDSGDWPLSG